MDRTFSLLAKTVLQAEDLEQLTRPLLEMLGSVTGMESTYLTTIDLAQGVQHVEFACNTDRLHIPEGLNVPWADTLCKRALDEGRMHTDNVSECWGDSEAARALGIRTYVSSPVKTQDGRLLGTLCAASAQPHPLNPSSASTLGLFSRFIGMFIERELLVAQLTAANERLSALALTDSLTALPNRLAIMTDLSRMLAQARREEPWCWSASSTWTASRSSTTTMATRLATTSCKKLPSACATPCVTPTSSADLAAMSSWSWGPFIKTMPA